MTKSLHELDEEHRAYVAAREERVNDQPVTRVPVFGFDYDDETDEARALTGRDDEGHAGAWVIAAAIVGIGLVSVFVAWAIS